MQLSRTLMALVAFSASAAFLACGANDESASPAAASTADGGTGSGGGDAATKTGDEDASTSQSDGGTSSLGGSGKLTATGQIGAPGTTPAPFTFDQPIGTSVRMKKGAAKIGCGDVLLEYVGDHLVAEVVGCASGQTIDVNFDLPLEAGNFPSDNDKYPRALLQLWRASKSEPFLDQGSASYGNRFQNKGATLEVTNVVPKTGTLDLDLHLSGTFDLSANPSCTTCTVGGSTLTFDLTLELANVPSP